MTLTFICAFRVSGELMFVESDRGIEAFSNGFWVNLKGDYTTGSDAHRWIPPGKIEYVYKQYED